MTVHSLVAVAPSPDTSGTSFEVTEGTGIDFPVTPFFAQLWPADIAPTSENSEIVQVTEVVVDTFTCVRGAYGTTGQPVTVGFQVLVVVPNHPGTIVASIQPKGYGEATPIVGASIRFAASVTDISGAPVNPDNLSVAFRCQGQPRLGPFTYTLPTGDPSNTVTYSGTEGSYFVDYVLPNSGNWTVQFVASPSSGIDITATSAITELEVLVSQSGV